MEGIELRSANWCSPCTLIKIYRTLISRADLHGCETRSLSVREVFEYRAFFETGFLRKMFRHKREEVIEI